MFGLFSNKGLILTFRDQNNRPIEGAMVSYQKASGLRGSERRTDSSGSVYYQADSGDAKIYVSFKGRKHEFTSYLSSGENNFRIVV